MTEAQTILKMIEEVDSSDTAKLDEIDARVWCWIDRVKYKEHHSWGSDGKTLAILFELGGCEFVHWGYRYTRSRDALKTIRFKDWWFEIGHSTDGLDWMAEMSNMRDKAVISKHLQTEELAELHAIIQAIEFERNKDER